MLIVVVSVPCSMQSKRVPTGLQLSFISQSNKKGEELLASFYCGAFAVWSCAQSLLAKLGKVKFVHSRVTP